DVVRVEEELRGSSRRGGIGLTRAEKERGHGEPPGVRGGPGPPGGGGGPDERRDGAVGPPQTFPPRRGWEPRGVNPTKTRDGLKAYAAQLRRARNASPHTLRAYVGDVQQFLAVCTVGDTARVTSDTVRHWLRTLDGAAARTSIARKLAAVRGFFRFLLDTGR